MNRTPDLAVPYILRLVTASLSPDTEKHRHLTPVPHYTPFSPSYTIKEAIKKILELIV
jgi:hypothetical protein